MAHNICRANYYHTTVEDRPGEAFKLLSQFASLGISLLAFTAVPSGIMRTQLTLFPEDDLKMADVAKKAGLGLDGPHPALLVRGDDELGALAGIHAKLYEANVNVYASSAITDGKGSYGYIVYIKPEEYETAAATLEA